MDTDPLRDAAAWLGLTRAEWVETGIAVAVVFGAIALAAIVAFVATRIIHAVTRSTETQLDDQLGHAVRSPLIALITVGAVGSALQTLSYLPDEDRWIPRVTASLIVLVVAIAMRRILLVLIHWQTARPGLGDGRLHPGTLPLIQRGVTLLVFAAAGMIVLDTLGLAISPLLAGLGIGGIAVALALQPLLANVFASSYMLSDSSIRVGDWIEVEGGPVGAVDDIGWRATRILSFDNNIVVVPNSTLASSIVTNYSLTSLEADLRVNVGVAYEEDLAHVEEVCIDIITTLRDESEASVKDYEPLVRFQSFGDSNVDILLKMRAQTWSDSFLLRHELMKRVHARFTAEGITINYPARRLILQPEDTTGIDQLRRPGDS